jgi:hypothetical protein
MLLMWWRQSKEGKREDEKRKCQLKKRLLQADWKAVQIVWLPSIPACFFNVTKKI